MADNVVQADFGRERNEAERRLARLVGLLDNHHADVRKDPVKFLEQAGDEIVKLRREMRLLQEAMFPPMPFSAVTDGPPRFIPFDKVQVTREDYERMKRCEDIVRDWRT